MQHKLTIVHVVHSLEVGGLENGLVNLVNHLPSDRFDHIICCLSRSGSLATRIVQKNVTICEVGLDMTRFRFPVTRLAKLFRCFNPVIVHTRGWSAVDAVFAAKLAMVPHVIHGEHGRDASDPNGRNFKRIAIRRAFSPLVDRFIAVSDDLRLWLTGTVGISEKKVVTIHNGVDTAKFAPLFDSQVVRGPDLTSEDRANYTEKSGGVAEHRNGPIVVLRSFPRSIPIEANPAKGAVLAEIAVGAGPCSALDFPTVDCRPPSFLSALRHSLGLPAEGALVGTVGRLDPVKDHENLLRAFAGVSAQEPATTLVLVGDGPLRDNLARSALRLGLQGKVKFLGERHDVPDILKALDVFVLSSVAEGISNTILESMASGLPVIATRVGGNLELVENGINGRLVDPGDASALAAAILEYVQNRQLRFAHGTAARQRVTERFSLQQMARSYERHYLEVGGVTGIPRQN